MPVLVDIAQLCTCPPDAPQGEIGTVADAAIAWEHEQIVWVGARADLPAIYADKTRHSAGNGLVVPGLIDCHTHLAFAGDRSGEYVEKIKGTTYLEIARRGGGILSTVRATRGASEHDLLSGARASLDAMLRRGVTTVEAKSGYGLNVADELKQLRVYKTLADEGPQRIVPTFLGAHTVPPEFADDRNGYLRLLTDELLPLIASEGLALFCDAFVEQSAFTPDEARRLFAAASALGLVPKLHADQLSDTGGGALAAQVGAASADHLEYISEASIGAMARAGTVAVSLPLATLVLNVEPLPARRLIEAGVPVAVATDFNPGSAPVDDLPLAMWTACVRQRMTPAEVLHGATAIAAKALRQTDIGSLLPGFRADIAVIDASSIDAWLYRFRPDAVRRTFVGGRLAFG